MRIFTSPKEMIDRIAELEAASVMSSRSARPWIPPKQRVASGPCTYSASRNHAGSRVGFGHYFDPIFSCSLSTSFRFFSI